MLGCEKGVLADMMRAVAKMVDKLLFVARPSKLPWHSKSAARVS